MKDGNQGLTFLPDGIIFNVYRKNKTRGLKYDL